jgi:penicillin-binding protein 2
VIAGRNQVSYAPVTIETDAGTGVLTELAERQNDYPGVTQEPVAIRQYPFGEMAAQALGYVGQVNKRELKMPGFRGVTQGTVVGQEGLEYYYDRYLRGREGDQKVKVNALGEPVPVNLPPTQPHAGYTLKVTLDLGLQQEAERALRDEIKASGTADAGGFVAMDPRNGQILAIGSYPSFDPNKFAKPLTEKELHALEGIGTGEPAPLTNRAANGDYPTGSTFKPITAIAALEGGVIDPFEGLGGGQCITVGAEQFCNASHADYGAVGLVEALKVSSDTYFFTVGELANSHGDVIQNMAHRLGIGRPTGIDLPSETTGTVPSRQWLVEQNKLESQCERAHHGHRCYIVAEPGEPWTVGYNMDLAVGQGSLQTDPLQMAVAYSTLANAYMNNGAGTVVRPHLGMAIDDANGDLAQALTFSPARHIRFDPTNLNYVMEGIHDATSESGGTSADVWSGWDQAAHPVYGKTGTAEKTNQVEQSWYMCYVADPTRPIVIAVTIEQGGWGDKAAAPVARLIASQWFNQPLKLETGSNPDH